MQHATPVEAPADRALTVKNPWAWAIIHAGKDVENRSRPTSHRGRLYIHAGKGYASDALKFPAFSTLDLDFDVTGETRRGIDVRGLVIGTVDVIDCHSARDCWTGWEAKDGETHEERCSEWAMEDHYHWVLADPRPLATPFPARGQLGIWRLEQ
jgi:hypothetical protein